MAEHSEDDALTWAGDDDLIAPSARSRARRRADSGESALTNESADDAEQIGSRTPVAGAAGSESAAGRSVPSPSATATAAETPSQLSIVALLSIGVVIGVYALFTVGWVIGSGRVVVTDGLNPVESFMTSVGRWAAVSAPAIWAAAVLWLGRSSSLGVRLAFLAVGAVLLIPWPFVMQG